MDAGIGTTHFMSGLRKHMVGGHKMAPDFKKAKGQLRPVVFLVIFNFKTSANPPVELQMPVWQIQLSQQ